MIDNRLSLIEISNLSSNVSTSVLRDLFERFGSITHIEIRDQGENRVCLIQYKSSTNCEAAVSFSGTNVEGRSIKVKLMTYKEVALQELEKFNRSIEMIGPIQMNSASEQTKRTIYVGNLKPGIMEHQIRVFFHSVGDIRYIKMVTNEGNKTYCFVEFNDLAAATRAFTFHGAKLAGRPVQIGRANNPIAGTGVHDILTNPDKLSQAKINAQLALNNLEAKKRRRSSSRDWEKKRSRRKRARSRSLSRSRSRRSSRERRKSRRRRSSNDKGRSTRRLNNPWKSKSNMFWDGFHWLPKQSIEEEVASKDSESGKPDVRKTQSFDYSQSMRPRRSTR